MTETWKVARACFIGGAICCAVALLVAPAFWWLGIIAGFCAGYLAYEFGEVLRAIPVAFRAIVEQFKGVGRVVGDVFSSLVAWLSEQHPYAYGSFVLGCVEAVALVYVIYPSSNPEANNVYFVAFVLIVFSAIGYLISIMVLATIVEFGQECDKTYYKGIPETYANVYYWTGSGLAHVVLYFLWGFWRHLGIGVWTLVRLIHSHKRTLCAVDGTLGGIIALIGFAYYGPATPTFAEYVMVVLFGGFIGATLGAANWELISKRVFGFGVDANRA